MGRWALILGASSGFGAAASRALASRGFDICGLHLDRRATLPQAEAVAEDVRALGQRALLFNKNAADARIRASVLEELESHLDASSDKVTVVLHSLAFGSLRPYLPDSSETSDNPTLMDAKAMAMTLDVMAHSLVYWVQDLLEKGLLALPGARVLALTSAGASTAWPSYGAVSAAKAALEAHCRQLALELGPRGGTANALCAGACDTPALRKIPNWQALLADAGARNPSGRTTTPEDVAQVITLLCRPEAAWINGAVIPVDGGEGIAGLPRSTAATQNTPEGEPHGR